jgi:TolB-like protein/Tfp pilus assembly protein PilF
VSLFAELKRRNVLRVGAAYAVLAWLVIQVVETIFPAFGFGDAAVRLVTIAFAVGLVPTLILAWVFELTPEGLKKESEVDRSQAIAPRTLRKLDGMIMVVLALAVGYFAFDKFVLEPHREAKLQAQVAGQVEEARQQGRTEARAASLGNRSIAVLPFVNMSDDAGNEFFSDGISEELLNLLARIPELRVISRSSAFSFKGKDLSIPEIAERLDVAHVLEGSVRKAGDRVRITAQLIEARSDAHLWSQTYDRTLDDIFAIQDEIAAMVVERLKITLLGGAPKAQETEPAAYALFLQARFLGRQFTAESLEQSIDLYRQALAIDPEYAPAWDHLSASYSNQADYGLLSQEEGYAKARAAAEQALAIDPGYSGAYASLGWIAMGFDRDLAQAARYYQKAIALDPTDTANIRSAAVLIQNLGRLDEAIALNRSANTRDPLNPVGHHNLGIAYLLAGRWDEAIASFETALRLSPDMIGVHNKIGTVLLFKSEPGAALAELALEEGDEGFGAKVQALALYALGREQEYEARREELIEHWGAESPSAVAQVYAYVGDADAAFQWLDRAIEQDEAGLIEQARFPFFSPLHADPRWARFLERVGSSPEQLQAIGFEVTLP